MKSRCKSLMLLVLSGVFTQWALAQKLDTLKNWRIHKYVDREASLVQEANLSNVPSRILPASFIKELGHLDPIVTDVPLIVQTVNLLSYEDNNGKMVKVIACGVGNFIFIDRFQKYWRIPEEKRDSWLEIISDEIKRIP